jgi:hypothetical protein
MEFNGSAFTTAAIVYGLVYGLYAFSTRGTNNKQNSNNQNNSNKNNNNNNKNNNQSQIIYGGKKSITKKIKNKR